MKKGQITVFILLGMALLLSVGIFFIIYSVGEKKEKVLSEEHGRQASVEPIKNYVSDCLKSVSSTALILLGVHGFHLSVKEGGITSNPEHGKNAIVLPDKSFVYYLINMSPKFKYPPTLYPNYTNDPSDKVGFPEADYPHLKRNVYPWFLFPYKSKLDKENKTFVGNGLFGWNIIPSLEKNFSNSIQESLEKYVSLNIVSCPQWSAFKEKGINAFPESPVTSVIFTSDSTDFVLKWPIRVETAGGSSTTISEFFVSHPVRLKYIYNHIKSLIDNDITDVMFNMTIQPYVDVKFFGEQGSVVSYKHSDSQLDFKPYFVSFARPNRAPVLEEINQKELVQYAFLYNNPTISECPKTPSIKKAGQFLLSIFMPHPDIKIKGKSLPNPVKINISVIDPDEFSQTTFEAKPVLPAPVKSPSTILRIFTKDDGILQDFQDIEIKGASCSQ